MQGCSACRCIGLYDPPGGALQDGVLPASERCHGVPLQHYTAMMDLQGKKRSNMDPLSSPSVPRGQVRICCRGAVYFRNWLKNTGITLTPLLVIIAIRLQEAVGSQAISIGTFSIINQ
ncbi:unnamed protein product [Urochloa humidicola]